MPNQAMAGQDMARSFTGGCSVSLSARVAMSTLFTAYRVGCVGERVLGTSTGSRSVDRGRRSVVFRFDSIHATRYEAARVQQMLRTEAALGPAAAIVEFDP